MMCPKSEQPVAPDKTSRQETVKSPDGDTRTRALMEAIPDFMFLFKTGGRFPCLVVNHRRMPSAKTDCIMSASSHSFACCPKPNGTKGCLHKNTQGMSG
jgi:hypothetical protein